MSCDRAIRQARAELGRLRRELAFMDRWDPRRPIFVQLNAVCLRRLRELGDEDHPPGDLGAARVPCWGPVEGAAAIRITVERGLPRRERVLHLDEAASCALPLSATPPIFVIVLGGAPQLSGTLRPTIGGS
jgi:hypothetical protein